MEKNRRKMTKELDVHFLHMLEKLIHEQLNLDIKTTIGLLEEEYLRNAN
ncbi:MAG: hypothetical protein ACJAT4_001849 [Granulosicoccus sp.]|jgi:hypothetical protein